MAAPLKVFSIEELKAYDGRGTQGKIYVGLCGKVFDVTDKGRHFYGAGGPYSIFAGRDATLGLAKFNMKVTDEVCDLSTLSQRHLEHAKKWEETFSGKYPMVGVLESPKPQAEQPRDGTSPNIIKPGVTQGQTANSAGDRTTKAESKTSRTSVCGIL